MRFHRLAHFKYQPIVKVGDTVVRGKTVLSRIGNTGRSSGSHVHHDGLIEEQKDWHKYTSIPFSKYFDTESYAPYVLPYEGRYFTNRHSVAHRGYDGNVKPDDEGLPVYSPVDGVVVYVEPAISIYRLVNGLRTLFQPTWGGGFGNFIVIRETVAVNEDVLLSEATKHPELKSAIIRDVGVLVYALNFLGYSTTDIINSYFNMRRTGKQIFDFTKHR